MKCEYYGCYYEATQTIIVAVDDPETCDSYNEIINACQKCYDKYMKAMEEQ